MSTDITVLAGPKTRASGNTVVSPSQSRAATPDQAPDLHESRARLSRLDTWEWFRWISVLFIALLLTAGLFSLSAPILHRDWFAQMQLDIKVRALFGLVLLFGAFTLYQQLIITRLRREFTSRVGMAATLEMLKPAGEEAEAQHAIERQWERYHLDRRITVEGIVRGKPATIYGRTSDISEGGVGAVLPEAFSPGDQVVLHLPLGPNGADISIPAVVCHRRGFYHGYQFRPLTEAERVAVRQACQDAPLVKSFRR